MQSSGFDVFISYKRRTGADFAQHLKEGLEGEKIRAFLDIVDIPKRIRDETQWQNYRNEAIQNSRLFLIMVTDGIENSKEVSSEIDYAQKNKIDFAVLKHKGLKNEIKIAVCNNVLDLSRFNQIEFDTKEDLLRKVLRILREFPEERTLEKLPTPSLEISKQVSDKKTSLRVYSTEEIIGELEDYQVDMIRGNWCLKKKNYEKAIELFERALIEKPDCIECSIKMGIALDSLGKKQEAIEFIDRALDIKPSALGFGLKATILGSQGKYEDAIDFYDKSIKIEPLDFAYYNKGHYLNKLERYQEALSSFDKAIELNPNDPDHWYGKAFLLFQQSKFQDAIKSINKAISIKQSTEAFALKGFLLMNLKLLPDAKLEFEKAKELDKKYSVALIGLSETSLILGNYESGLENARKAFVLSKSPADRIFSWLLIITSNYLLNLIERAQKETKELLAFLKFQKHFYFKERTFDCSILVELVKEKLSEKESSELIGLFQAFSNF